jgi:hypothetical protein
METFAQRAQDMGLDVTYAAKGLYKYEDQYSEVVYRQMMAGVGHDEHPTDGEIVPLLGIFTKDPTWTDYRYVGYVSNAYKFIGNDVLNQRLRDSIQEVGIPIMEENAIISYDCTSMRNEVIIQSSQNVGSAGIINIGDVLPVMIVNNSYNGTRAASVSFGIAINENNNRLIFAFGLGEMRQVHIASSNTNISSAINSYMQVFNNDITNMISESFRSQLTEDEMLGVLDVIEGFGKKRREAVSSLLSEIQGQTENPLPTAWQMFLAIVRYSSFEPNLNIKRMMENAAESVLVIPERMYGVLDRL